MFNTRIGDDEAATEEIVQVAAARATAPGQTSVGNASGTSGVTHNLIVEPPGPSGPHDHQIGIDPNGVFYYPFQLGIDTPDDLNAYVPTGFPVYDYGN